MVIVPADDVELVVETPWRSGARQFVVQEALEMMLCFAGSYLSSFTPSTMVMSSSLAGAEMMTFFTVPRRCLLRVFGVGEAAGGFDHDLRATDSQSSLAGSFSAKTWIFLPSISMESRAGRDLVRQIAEDRVVLKKMGQRLRIGQIVDRHEFDVLVVEERCAERCGRCGRIR